MSVEMVSLLSWVAAVFVTVAGVLVGGFAWRRSRFRRRRVWSIADGGRTDSSPSAPGGLPWRFGAAMSRRVWWLRSDALRGGAVALSVAAFGVVCVGGVLGSLGGVAAGVAVWRWLRRRGREAGTRVADARERAVARALPLSAELMAACLTAGSSPAQAADAVGRSLGGCLGDRLVRAAAELRLGGEPSTVWARFGALESCRTLARCMERTGTTGVPAVDVVSRFAEESRVRRSRDAATRARRAAVLVTGPLGLCFLPAFLAVGVVPVVLGLSRSLL